MALYLVEHHHTAENCPRNNPEIVRQLSEYVTDANASKLGVKIVADWTCEPEHTVLLILDTDSPEKAREFARPFLQVGTVTVKEGRTCREVAQECLAAV